MTSAEAALIVVAVVGASLAGAYFHIEKAKRRPSERARIIAAARARTGLTVWDTTTHRWVHLPPGVQPGPGQMTNRDIEEADQLELLWLSPAYDEAAAAVDEGLSRLFEELGPPPTAEEGLAELRQAIRDEQQKGDPA